MWKDFFYFSKGQRRGIIVLLILIVSAFVINELLPLFYPDINPFDPSFNVEVEQFKKSLKTSDSLKQRSYYGKSTYQENSYPVKDLEKSAEYKLKNFNPNTIDSLEFIQLGLMPHVTSNILKYRRKGGVFKTKESFSKVYGISLGKYTELEQYIVIPSVQNLKKDSINIATTPEEIVLKVELNTADTTELMKIKGIGSGYAKGIVRFRNTTGGFVSVMQLKEIYGMTSENFERIKSFCEVNSSLIRKINVNTSSTEKLNSHPYINFYQAKAIYELRRNKGKLTDIQELNRLSEFSPESLSRIKPYLSFE